MSYRTLQCLLLGCVALGVVACASILGFRRTSIQTFEHRAHVLEGITCEQCHQGVASAGETGPLHIPSTATCIGCHEKPHDSRECSTCHSHGFAQERAAQARQYLRFEHSTHVPRVKGNCVRCHSDIARDAQLLRPQMASCFTCHEHKEGFKAETCDDCHQNLRAESVRPSSHLAHGNNFIAEHGAAAASSRDLCSSCHSESSCAACHGQSVPALPRRLSFDTPTSASIHRGGFLGRHSMEARAQPALCSTCHTTDYCSDCHSDRQLAAPRATSGSPHSAGWVGLPNTPNRHGRAARVNPAECASCHSGAGEVMCVGCHRVGGIGGNPHPPGYQSRLRINADLPCRLCHGGAR